MKNRGLQHHLSRFLAIGMALFAVLTVGPVSAQTTTGTIRGTVTANDGTPAADAELIAKLVATGSVRTTTSRPDGSYILPGLVPAVYELDRKSVV